MPALKPQTIVERIYDRGDRIFALLAEFADAVGVGTPLRLRVLARPRPAAALRADETRVARQAASPDAPTYAEATTSRTSTSCSDTPPFGLLAATRIMSLA